MGISKSVSQSKIRLRCLGMSQALQTIAQAINKTEPLRKPVHALVPVGSAIFGHVPMSKDPWRRRWTTCATVSAHLWQLMTRMHRGIGISVAASREAARMAPLQANGHVIGGSPRSQWPTSCQMIRLQSFSDTITRVCHFGRSLSATINGSIQRQLPVCSLSKSLLFAVLRPKTALGIPAPAARASMSSFGSPVPVTSLPTVTQ